MERELGDSAGGWPKRTSSTPVGVTLAMELLVVPKSMPTAGSECDPGEDMKGYYGASGKRVRGALAGRQTMGVEKDLATIAEQERALQFDRFGAEMAWVIGCGLREEAVRIGKAMTFEIQVAGRVLFLAATEGASGGQADWVRRKRNTVMRFGRSSYAVGLQLELDGQTMEARHGLALSGLCGAWRRVSDRSARDGAGGERDCQRAAAAGGSCAGGEGAGAGVGD